MPRSFPAECPDSPAIQTATGLQYNISFITPLLGGGATAKLNDAVTLVRGPSIRGQLRFWWRATRGRGCKDAAALYERESQIWGNTSSASKVRIEVTVTNAGSIIGEERAKSYPKYVVFPFIDGEVPKSHVDVAFLLRLMLPLELKDDVEAAIWAWTNFGGIGSRTRRGCGAIYCAETAPANENSIPEWWRKMQARCPQFDGAARGWPVLGPAAMTGPLQANAHGAWTHVIQQWQYFRQQPGFARNKGGQRPGRSRWPEADSLKAKTEKAAYGHETSITITDPKNAPAFPRATLGLPIVFDFRPNREETDNKGTLEPLDAERMASPFLLRPWRFGNGKAMPLVIPLYAPGPGALKYRFKSGNWNVPGGYEAHTRTELETYSGSPMGGLTAMGSAAEAFQNFLCLDRGFQVVAQ